MERILILMQAANWAEATEALTSARENALHRNALSYALVLQISDGVRAGDRFTQP